MLRSEVEKRAPERACSAIAIVRTPGDDTRRPIALRGPTYKRTPASHHPVRRRLLLLLLLLLLLQLAKVERLLQFDLQLLVLVLVLLAAELRGEHQLLLLLGRR